MASKLKVSIVLCALLTCAAWGQQRGCTNTPYGGARHIRFCGYESPGDTECVELPESYRIPKPPIDPTLPLVQGQIYYRLGYAEVVDWADLPTTQPSVTAQIEEEPVFDWPFVTCQNFHSGQPCFVLMIDFDEIFLDQLKRDKR